LFHADRQTDTTKLTVAFPNSANARKKKSWPTIRHENALWSKNTIKSGCISCGGGGGGGGGGGLREIRFGTHKFPTRGSEYSISNTNHDVTTTYTPKINE
jgi:hypothetical protein